jgi:glycine/sarcosine/betaine reductase complex component C subunit beta
MYPVIKGASYALIHAPHLLWSNGTTQTMERKKDSDSEYLKKLPDHLRDFHDVVAYPPNQVYIGNFEPGFLASVPRPWFENQIDSANRFGTYGEIMPEDEFFGIMKIVDAFDLVQLEEQFADRIANRLSEHPLIDEKEVERVKKSASAEAIQKMIEHDHAEALIADGEIVGCVKKAHGQDENLTAHIMTENLAAKASAYLAVKHLLSKTEVSAHDIDYIIEASEEACGDMNQRGGGNFAKAIGEAAGCLMATGADTRAFCAGPAHAVVQAAALVQSGIFQNVIVTGGGAVAKLGMNGKEHVAKGLPVLEDVLGAFALLICKNDGIHPIIRTDAIGRHRIGSGSSPQAVIQAIVTDPLDGAKLKIADIDKYSVEMQNPEITEPAGAGDVPKANYKMIGALAVKRGEMERADLDQFVKKHGMHGFAPTQGHIPSGVPFVGPAVDMIMSGQMTRAMIIGKGSLFLARMTNQFDGISFIMEANSQESEHQEQVSPEQIRKVMAEAMRDAAKRILDDDGRSALAGR